MGAGQSRFTADGCDIKLSHSPWYKNSVRPFLQLSPCCSASAIYRRNSEEITDALCQVLISWVTANWESAKFQVTRRELIMRNPGFSKLSDKIASCLWRIG